MPGSSSSVQAAETFVALFGGINVGGNNILPMQELTEVLTSLGLSNIKTYIQSGNVVFHDGYVRTADLTLLSQKIGAAIAKSHGFTPQVLVLTRPELAAAAASNPFPEAEREPKTLLLFFLASKPEHPDIDLLERLQTAEERFRLTEAVFYLHAPAGIGRSKLAAKVEKALGVPLTARNWQTVSKLLSLSAALTD